MGGDEKRSSAFSLKDVPEETRRELWKELKAEFGVDKPVDKMVTKQARLKATTLVLSAIAELGLNEQRSILRFVNDLIGQANKRWSRG